MKKPTDEHLADIESAISRLTKMQGCVIRLLLILRKRINLFEARVSASTLVTVSMETYHQHANRFLALMIGAITAVGVAASLLALYFATLDSAFIRMSAVLFILFFILFIFGFLEHRSMNREFREAKKERTQTKKVIDTAKEKGVALDEELAQVLAEWEKLVPDDLASEPKSED